MGRQVSEPMAGDARRPRVGSDIVCRCVRFEGNFAQPLDEVLIAI